MKNMIFVNIDRDRTNVITNGYQKAFYVSILDEYFYSEVVCWVAWYERYYHISKEDYELFSVDIDKFNEKYKKEHEQKSECFSENFAGSGALRDYDGMKGFQQCFPCKENNSYQYNAYIDGVLYAIIEWEKETILVPPFREVVSCSESKLYPLREKCELQMGPDNKTPICYKLKGLSQMVRS